MTVSEEGEYVGCGIEEQSDPSVHNCSTSCAMGPGLRYRQSGSLEHFDSQCLGSKRG